MAYEDLVLFVSFGWFISVAVMFIMYMRIRQLSEEVKLIKNTVQLSDDDMLGSGETALRQHLSPTFFQFCNNNHIFRKRPVLTTDIFIRAGRCHKANVGAEHPNSAGSRPGSTLTGHNGTGPGPVDTADLKLRPLGSQGIKTALPRPSINAAGEGDHR